MDYFNFAFRNLKKKGIRSYLTLLGIFIGILAVVSLITLGGAMKTAITSQFGAGSTEVISVQAGGLQYGAPGSGVVKPLTQDDVDKISRIDSVEFAVGRNIDTVSFEYNNNLKITSAYSVNEKYDKQIYEILDDVQAEQGRLLKSGDTNKIYLGNGFADGTKNGFGKDIYPGKQVLIDGKTFVVEGILKKKGSFIYDNTIFMYEKELNSLTGNVKNVDIIQVKVRNKDLVNKTEGEIERVLRQQRNVKVGEEDFKVSTPDATLKTVNSVLGAIQAFIIIIASISIIVGTIGIVNTMSTSVLERRKEIGIMKAIGAKNSQIFLQFFVESGFLGLIGGALGAGFGILVGVAGTYAINNWLGATIQPSISLGLIFFSLVGSFLIGAIAGIVPAMHAAKQNPVEALRG